MLTPSESARRPKSAWLTRRVTQLYRVGWLGDGSRRPADEALGGIQPPELILISGVVSPNEPTPTDIKQVYGTAPPRPHKPP